MLSYLLEHHEIGHYSGYKTHVVADYFYEIMSEDDLYRLHEIFLWSRESNIPFLIIGWWTNLLFTSPQFSWVVIKNSLSWWSYDEDSKILHAYSNESIWNIATELEMDHDQPIWHRFIWLPGSIGGAVFGNAGCFGLETESNFAQARIYDMQEWRELILSKEDIQFAYRHSYLKDNPNLFLIDAYFDLSEKREKYHSDIDNLYFREHEQPHGNSCGSFFKNPSREVSAWALIESVGLKWYQLGWARWSSIHANFLMSDGESCSPSDLIGLVRLTQEKVSREKWYDLVNEVRIIDNSNI